MLPKTERLKWKIVGIEMFKFKNSLLSVGNSVIRLVIQMENQPIGLSCAGPLSAEPVILNSQWIFFSYDRPRFQFESSISYLNSSICNFLTELKTHNESFCPIENGAAQRTLELLLVQFCTTHLKFGNTFQFLVDKWDFLALQAAISSHSFWHRIKTSFQRLETGLKKVIHHSEQHVFFYFCQSYVTMHQKALLQLHSGAFRKVGKFINASKQKLVLSVSAWLMSLCFSWPSFPLILPFPSMFSSSVIPSPCTIKESWLNDWRDGCRGWRGREGGREEWVCRDARLHLSALPKKGCSGGVKRER